nr:hypothetical protein RVX_3225 [Nitratidesulfovibrio sp. HK-II]
MAEAYRLFLLAVDHVREHPPAEDERHDQADEERCDAAAAAFAAVRPAA